LLKLDAGDLARIACTRKRLPMNFSAPETTLAIQLWITQWSGRLGIRITQKRLGRCSQNLRETDPV